VLHDALGEELIKRFNNNKNNNNNNKVTCKQRSLKNSDALQA